MAVGDSSAPKAGSNGRPGRGPPREKQVLVAAAEVVGRPLAVWSQKLLDWPKAVIAAYKPESQEHLIRYEDPQAMGVAEKWVKLGSTRFQWLQDQPRDAGSNPTWASVPRHDDCVGRRLKVFWPGMGRWYQGKIQSYDPVSDKHCIKYRDGDVQELRLRHEALIWVDTGPLPPARPPSAQQQQPQTAGGGKGAKPAGQTATAAGPAAGKAQKLAAGSSPAGPAAMKGAGARAALAPSASPAAAAVLTGQAVGAGVLRRSSPAAGKRPRAELESSSGDERLRSNKSSATRQAGLAAAASPASAPAGGLASPGSGAATRKEQPAPAAELGAAAGAAAGGGGSSNMGSAYSGPSADADEGEGGLRGTDSGSSSEGDSEDEGDVEEEEDAEMVEADDGDSSVVTDDLGSEVYSSDLDLEAESEDLDEVSYRNAGGARSGGTGGRRRQGATGATSVRSGQGRKRSRGPGSRKHKKPVGRPRKSGSGPSAQDRHLKAGRELGRPKPALRPEDEAARLAGGSVVGARVAVLWPQDGKFYKGKLMQFDSYHKRSKILYDDGEEEWVSLSRESFKWLTPRGRSAGFCGELLEAVGQLGALLEPLPATLPAPAEAGAGARGQSGAQAPATAAVAAASPSPVGEVADVAAKGAPKAEAAVGWQVSVLFDGDGHWYRGEAVAYDKRRGRHLVLFDDGEDEWLALEHESVAWHKLARGANTVCPGIKPGTPAPRGRAAVGWRVGVFWSADMVFYSGEVSGFEAATGRHTVAYDDGDVRTISLSTDKMKWMVPPGCVVNAARLISLATEPSDPAAAAAAAAAGAAACTGATAAAAVVALARGRPRKGLVGESDPDYEYERRTGMRRLPRLLTTSSFGTGSPLAGLHPGATPLCGSGLPAEASMAQQLLQHGGGCVGSPSWAGAAHQRSSGPIMQMSLAPTTEQPLGEPVLVRQLTRIPTLGSCYSSSSGESEATQLPAPITVRLYMSSTANSGGSGGSPGSAGASGAAIMSSGAAAAGPQPAADSGTGVLEGAGGEGQALPGGRRQPLTGPQAQLHILDSMSRRVARAQHSMLKGVPTHLPTHAPHATAQEPSAAAAAAAAAGALSPSHLQRGGLHRLARSSTADHPLSPTHRRPHPAQSDEEASSSGSSSDEEEECDGREESPAALLSPRSAAALNGAKVKPGLEAPQGSLDLDLLVDPGGEGTATPSESDALGPIPPLLRPTPPAMDSPFSAGGLLRSSAALAGAAAAAGAVCAGPAPLPIYPGRPLFPSAGMPPSAAAAGSGGSGAREPGPGAALDAIVALAPGSDPMSGLLGGPTRHDSEFNLLAMAGPDPMEGLMDLEEGVAGGAEELSTAAVLVDPGLPA
ncbi:hypothetical protein N2152v2_007419 [Parachlorella kessleri]